MVDRVGKGFCLVGLLFPVLGMELRPLHVIEKYSPTQLPPHPLAPSLN